jgi:hypothetical protein
MYNNFAKAIGYMESPVTLRLDSKTRREIAQRLK